MESGPPKVIETIAGWLIPPASREEVLGDLRERATTTLDYLGDAARAIPCVIYSRIRRTTDPVVLLMNSATLYTCFVMAAFELARRMLADQATYARLAMPPLIVLITLVFADAYSNPKKRWPLKPLFAPMLGMALAFAWEHTLPREVMVWGSVVGVVLVSTLRLMFPPIPDRPEAATGPAHWQKLEIVPIRPRDTVMGVIVLAVMLYLWLRRFS